MQLALIMGRPVKAHLPKELLEVLRRVGANIQEVRQLKSMTQAELARLSKVSTTTLSDLESKRDRDMRLSTLVAISDVLGCDVARLFESTHVNLTHREHKQLLRASEDILRFVKKIQSDS